MFYYFPTIVALDSNHNPQSFSHIKMRRDCFLRRAMSYQQSEPALNLKLLVVHFQFANKLQIIIAATKLH